MRYITLVLVACLSITACGQKKEQLKNTKEMQTALIEKYTEQIWSEMTHYEIQPAYYLRLYQTNCTFEVFVNGIRAFRYHGLEKLGSAVSLNDFILKSGKQEVTVRMYPLGTLLQEEYGEENYDDILELLSKSNVEVKVTHISDLKMYQSASKDEKTLLIHNSPVDNQKEFVGKGLPYYEYSFDFEAKVPYDFEGWSNGVDLSKVDQDELKLKCTALNNDLKQLYFDKKGEEILKIFYNRIKRRSLSYYSSKEDIKDNITSIVDEIYGDKDTIFVKEEDLFFDFTSGSKLISQIVTNDVLKIRDLKYRGIRGYNTVMFINKRGKGRSIMNYFYMPKEYEGKEIHLEYIP